MNAVAVKPIRKVVDRRKLKALIHYAAFRCRHEPRALGAVKLNKVLWYSDLSAYLTWGESITGERYIKKPHGPVSSSLSRVVEEMETERAIALRKIPTYGERGRTEYLALTMPDVDAFNPKELALITEVIDGVCHKHSAESISRLSHDAIWRLTPDDEEIPFHAMLASNLHEVTSEDLEWARRELAHA